MRAICMCTGAIRISQLITQASDWSSRSVFNRQQHFLPSDRSCHTTHRARLLCNSCGIALTEFSLSRHAAVLLVPPSSSTLLQPVQRARASARTHACTHARRENKMLPPPPRERISRYAAPPRSAREEDRRRGQTKTGDPGSVGTQEVAADLAAAALLAMGSNRARSRGLFSDGKSERLSVAVRYFLDRGKLATSFFTTRSCRQTEELHLRSIKFNDRIHGPSFYVYRDENIHSQRSSSKPDIRRCVLYDKL